MVTHLTQTLFHYTYVVFNEGTEQFYIGVRSSKRAPEQDSYMGSSAILKRLMQEQTGPWHKYIVQTFGTRAEAMKHEFELTEPAVLLGEKCLNQCRGGNGWHDLSKRIPWNKGRKWSEEVKQKMRKPKTFRDAEHYAAWRESQKARKQVAWNKGMKLQGKPLSEEHKAAIKASWERRRLQKTVK